MPCLHEDRVNKVMIFLGNTWNYREVPTNRKVTQFTLTQHFEPLHVELAHHTLQGDNVQIDRNMSESRRDK